MERPIDAPKAHPLLIRLSDQDEQMLDECVEQLKLSKSDILRHGLKQQYEDLKQK
jgi:hypothetical protein